MNKSRLLLIVLTSALYSGSTSEVYATGLFGCCAPKGGMHNAEEHDVGQTALSNTRMLEEQLSPDSKMRVDKILKTARKQLVGEILSKKKQAEEEKAPLLSSRRGQESYVSAHGGDAVELADEKFYGQKEQIMIPNKMTLNPTVSTVNTQVQVQEQNQTTLQLFEGEFDKISSQIGSEEAERKKADQQQQAQIQVLTEMDQQQQEQIQVLAKMVEQQKGTLEQVQQILGQHGVMIQVHDQRLLSLEGAQKELQKNMKTVETRITEVDQLKAQIEQLKGWIESLPKEIQQSTPATESNQEIKALELKVSELSSQLQQQLTSSEENKKLLQTMQGQIQQPAKATTLEGGEEVGKLKELIIKIQQESNENAAITISATRELKEKLGRVTERVRSCETMAAGKK